MKKYIELDEMDIQQIIAEKFDCDLKDVQVEVVAGYSGYGPTESRTHKVKITVKQEVPVC